MPAFPPIRAWAERAALIATLLPLLSGCGPARNQFAPPCPHPAFLGDAANIDLFDPASQGARHDVTDLVLHGRLVGLQGSCKPGSSKGQLAATVVMSVELSRGPAMRGRDADVSVFLAITEGGAILDKHIYPLHVTFPPNIDRLVLNSSEQSVTLPVTATKSGAAYTIIAGFQLTPDELEQNRRGESR
jgi:hypothetical protein